ncbi:uncharacterized protein LOC135387214 [Ornithodoros turicata]|uniref:uncharacterized protein LOC135387214 n=1 Tax=Ornithodoros turicata TaxID=34597 RepID=UPI003139456C
MPSANFCRMMKSLPRITGTPGKEGARCAAFVVSHQNVVSRAQRQPLLEPSFLGGKADTLLELNREIQAVIPEGLLEGECDDCDRYLEPITETTVLVRSALASIVLPSPAVPSSTDSTTPPNYLISLLTEPAARAIAELAITDANYSTAVGSKSIDDAAVLRTLHDAVYICIRNLQGLGLQTAQYAVVIHRALLRKIPRQLELEYYKSKGPDDTGATADVLSTLLDFIETEVGCRERARRDTDSLKDDAPGSSRNSRDKRFLPPSASSLTAAVADLRCQWTPIRCWTVPIQSPPVGRLCRLSQDEVRNILRRERRCFLCGKRSHLSRNCRVFWKMRCQRCKKRHLTQLCPQTSTSEPQAPTQPPLTAAHAAADDVITSVSSSSDNLAFKYDCGSEVLLEAATVWLEGSNGLKQLVRLLLDGGSQRSFVWRDVSLAVGCHSVGFEELTIHILGNKTTCRTKYNSVQRTLHSQSSTHSVVINAIEYEHSCSDGLPSVPSAYPAN